eukprot:3454565-Pyramimonas_sp.AAC.1
MSDERQATSDDDDDDDDCGPDADANSYADTCADPNAHGGNARSSLGGDRYVIGGGSGAMTPVMSQAMKRALVAVAVELSLLKNNCC